MGGNPYSLALAAHLEVTSLKPPLANFSLLFMERIIAF